MIRKILAWICCFSVFLLLLTFLMGCTLVKKPVIRSAEFLLKLEYEFNGNLIVVEDVLICKYKGTSWDTSVGGHRVYDKELSRKFYNNNSYEDFGIKLISWTIDPPIENTFE